MIRHEALGPDKQLYLLLWALRSTSKTSLFSCRHWYWQHPLFAGWHCRRRRPTMRFLVASVLYPFSWNDFFIMWLKYRGLLKCPVVFAKCSHSGDCLVCIFSECMHPSFFAGQTVDMHLLRSNYPFHSLSYMADANGNIAFMSLERL